MDTQRSITDEQASDRATLAVMGCGNTSRGDDGVGPFVIRSLAIRGLSKDPRIYLLDAATSGIAVIAAARRCRRLIIVDACRSGAEPGTIHEASGRELAWAPEPSLTLHDFRWDHALFLARGLYGEDFPDITALLIEAESTGFGFELSPRVKEAAGRVAARIEAMARALEPSA
jgi:hydrogenase maturation protease